MSVHAKIARMFLAIQFSSFHKKSIQEQRDSQEKNARFMRVSPDTTCRPVSVNGVPAEWIIGPDVGQGVILYLHGGGYAVGSINSHREFVGRLGRAAKLRVLAIDYRLAPENPFPAALEDAVAAYRWLLDEGIDPSQIIFAGDSSGGGLALATLVALRDDGAPLPAAAVCFSPWTDLANSGDSIQTKAGSDPILRPGSLPRYAVYYVGDNPVTDPLISPLYASLEGLPPLLIHVGGDEILLDDATRFAKAARKAGGEVTLRIWDGMFHVFPLVPFLPETNQALGQIADFAAKQIKYAERD